MLSRSKIIFVATAVLVLSAGVVVGRLSARGTGMHPPGGKDAPWLTELNLSTTQRQQMDSIWAETKRKIGETGDRRHTMDVERDQAIRALLSDAQRTAYDKIFDDYRAKRQELDKARESAIHDAEARSRALLDPSQQKKWDVLAKEIHDHHGPPHGRDGHDGHGPGPWRPTTLPPTSRPGPATQDGEAPH